MRKVSFGFTLIELIIAMLMISIVMVVGFMIFLNLKYSSMNSVKIQATEFAEQQCDMVREQGIYINQEVYQDPFLITTTCDQYRSGIMRVTIKVGFPEGRVFCQINELMEIK